MSLVVIALAAGVAGAFGYFAARKLRPGEEDVRNEDGGDGARAGAGMKSGPSDKASGGATDRTAGREKASGKASHIGGETNSSAFATLPFALGDVVSADREERWLAGAIVARDGDQVVGVVFFAPEGAKVFAVAAFPAPKHDIFWMSPVAVVCPSEPPGTLEIAGVTLTRRGRLPVSLERVGQGAPRTASDGLWATYEGSGHDVALVLCCHGAVHAWFGRRFDENEYDRLGQGD